MLSYSGYKYKYLDLYQYLTNICLNITDDCNLQCRYCFVQQHPHYMTLQTAIDATNWLYKNLQKKKELGYCSSTEMASINFFGGEPTLLWDQIIVPLTNYIKEKYPNDIWLSMTTNGTLLNDERIEFLKKNDIGILLSIDGGPETQNWNRPCKNINLKSSDLVEKNIPKLLNTFPNLTFRATISQSSVATVFESYLYAEKMGFKRMFQIPNEREKWTLENIKILEEEIKKIYFYNLKYFLNNTIPPLTYDLMVRSFEYIKWIDEQLLHNGSRYCGDKNCDRCGLGTNYGSVGYNGNIYGCQEQDSRKDNDLFKIGNIYTGGIDIDKQKKLIQTYSQSDSIICEDPSLCDNCKMKIRCFDDCCPSTSYDMFGQLNVKSQINCLYYQFLIDNSLALMKILVNQNNEAFHSFLNTIYEKYDKEGVQINGSR